MTRLSVLTEFLGMTNADRFPFMDETKQRTWDRDVDVGDIICSLSYPQTSSDRCVDP